MDMIEAAAESSCREMRQLPEAASWRERTPRYGGRFTDAPLPFGGEATIVKKS